MFVKNFFFLTTYIPLKGAKYDSHIIEFWDRKNAFQDLDQPDEYCSKISVSFDSTTPSYARSKIVKNQQGNSPSRQILKCVLKICGLNFEIVAVTRWDFLIQIAFQSSDRVEPNF